MDGRRARRTGPAARATSATAVVLLTLAAAACGDDDPGDVPTETVTETVSPTESPDDTDTASPTDTPTETPTDDAPDDGVGEAPVPFPADVATDTQEHSDDAMLTVTDVRVASHDDYDRVVFELGGTGTPGWRVEYVDEAFDDGSGNPVDVDGDAILQIWISGSAYPMDSGVDEYAGPNPLRPETDEVVEEVNLRGIFEGYTQVFVGVDDGPQPFRVFSLEDPTRVVLDVRDD